MVEHLAVTYSFPALVDAQIDTIRAVVDGYAALQERSARQGWQPLVTKARSNVMYFDVDDYQGLTILPPYFLTKDLEAGKVEALAARLPLESLSAKVRLRRLRFFYLDYGVLVGNLDVEVEGITDATVSETVKGLEGLSSHLPGCLNGEIARLAAELKQVIPADYLRTPKRDGIESEAALWVHRIYCGTVGAGGDGMPLHQLAQHFTGRDACREHGNSALGTSEVVDVGLGRSVALRSTDSDNGENVLAITRSVINLQNAVWAGAYSMDRSLFFYQNKAMYQLGRKRSYEYTRQLHLEVNRYRREGRLFRSILFDNVIHQSPQTRTIWTQLAAAWKSEELIDAFEEKLARLDELNEDMSTYLIEGREYKLNAIVLALTLIGVGTVLLEVFNFSQGGIAEANGLRVSFVVAAMVITFLLGILSFRWLKR